MKSKLTSRLLKKYLQDLTGSFDIEASITSLVKSLSGLMILKDKKERKMDYSDWLNNKYQ